MNLDNYELSTIHYTISYYIDNANLEEDDKVAPIDVKKFTEYCVAFIDSLEIENES